MLVTKNTIFFHDPSFDKSTAHFKGLAPPPDTLLVFPMILKKKFSDPVLQFVNRCLKNNDAAVVRNPVLLPAPFYIATTKFSRI